VRQLRQQRAGAFGQARAAVEGVAVDVAAKLVEEELRQRRGLGQARIETGCSFLAHDRVRVLALGQEQEEGLAAVLHPRQHRLHRDRKSTRLNSSHVKISYAVFCLKKKKRCKKR